jgi:cytochrome c-type biogenesis protein
MLASGLPTLPLAFLAGLVSVLSPCVFPLIPAYAAYLSGEAGAVSGSGPGASIAYRRRSPVVLLGVAFVLGFSAVFIAAFYVLAALNVTVLLAHRQAVDIAAGIVVIAFALQTLGVIRIPWLMRDLRFHGSGGRRRGAAGAALMGLSFGAGWSPCLGPTLGAILVVAAGGGFSGLPLMLVYCVGLGVPFLVVAVLCDRLQGGLRAVNRHLRLVSLVAGLLLLAFGVMLLTGQVTQLSRISPGAPFDL